MISNPTIEERPEGWKPPQRLLMQDGVWLLPPEERPKGWEKMLEIREPAPFVKATAGPPPIVIKELPTKDEPETAALEPQQPPPERSWGNLQAILGALAEDESHLVPIPAGEALGAFRNRLRSILSAWKKTAAFRWKIRQENDTFRVIKLAPWRSAVDASRPLPPAAKPGNHTDPAIREQAEKLLKTGLSVRNVIKQLGLAKNTVLRIRATLGDLPPCECGKAGGHKGWCAPRVAKSPARQRTIRDLHDRTKKASDAVDAVASPVKFSYAAVIADLEARRDAIENAIRSLRALL